MRAGLFSNAPTYTNAPVEFRSCPREFDEKVLRVETGEQERELFFPLSSFSSRLPTRVLTNVCFGEETRLATMRS